MTCEYIPVIPIHVIHTLVPKIIHTVTNTCHVDTYQYVPQYIPPYMPIHTKKLNTYHIPIHTKKLNTYSHVTSLMCSQKATEHLNYLVINAAAQTYHGNIGKIRTTSA